MLLDKQRMGRCSECKSVHERGLLEACLTCGQVLCTKCIKTGHHGACIALPATDYTSVGTNLAGAESGRTHLEIAVDAANTYMRADAALDGNRSALDALPKGHYLHLDHVVESDAAYDKVHGPRCNECKLHFGFDVLVKCPECDDEYCPKCVRYLRHWPCTEDNKGAGNCEVCKIRCLRCDLEECTGCEKMLCPKCTAVHSPECNTSTMVDLGAGNLLMPNVKLERYSAMFEMVMASPNPIPPNATLLDNGASVNVMKTLN